MALLLVFGMVAVAIAVSTIALAAATTKKRRSRLILAAGALAILVVTSPLSIAWGRWLAAAAACGHQPVAASTFAASYSYSLPGDSFYDPGVWPLVPDYYCSASEAESHGFHRTS